jgi:hypothetical protein
MLLTGCRPMVDLGQHADCAAPVFCNKVGILQQNGGIDVMRNCLVTTTVIMFVMSSIACSAGPCTSEIAAVRERLNARLYAKAAVGPMAPESLGALRHRQPTPRSIAAAERQLGESSGQNGKIIVSALKRAGDADRVGDRETCENALDEIWRAISP